MRRESELAGLTWVRVQVDYFVGNADSNRHCPNIPKCIRSENKGIQVIEGLI